MWSTDYGKTNLLPFFALAKNSREKLANRTIINRKNTKILCIIFSNNYCIRPLNVV